MSLITVPTLAIIAMVLFAVIVIMMFSAQGGSPPDPASITDDMIANSLRSGRKIEAIRYYRIRYGVGLKEAKEAVERMQI